MTDDIYERVNKRQIAEAELSQHDSDRLNAFVWSVRKLAKSIEGFHPAPNSNWGRLLVEIKQHLAEFDKAEGLPEGTHDDQP